MLDKLLPGASQLQNYHPLIVHFPIAFIYGAALMYFLASILASENLKWTALWMLALGALGAAAAVERLLCGARLDGLGVSPRRTTAAS